MKSSIFIVLTIFILLMSISLANDDSPDASIDIKGKFGVIISIIDLRENPTDNITVDIWINYSYLIRPIINDPELELFHRNIFRNNTYASGLTWSRNPYRISFGKCEIEVTVGNVYVKKEGIVIGSFTFFN